MRPLAVDGGLERQVDAAPLRASRTVEHKKPRLTFASRAFVLLAPLLGWLRIQHDLAFRPPLAELCSVVRIFLANG